MQAQISVWEMLMASHVHRQAILDALNKLDISIDTTLEELVSFVSTKSLKLMITFLDEDLPPEGAS